MFSSRMRIYSLLIVVANVELRYSNTYYIIINRFVSIFYKKPPLFCMPLYYAWIPLLALHLVWSTIEHNVQYIVVIIAQIAQYSAIRQHSYFCKLWYDLLLTNQSNRAALQSLSTYKFSRDLSYTGNYHISDCSAAQPPREASFILFELVSTILDPKHMFP